jgi:hypothetical protein
MNPQTASQPNKPSRIYWLFALLALLSVAACQSPISQNPPQSSSDQLPAQVPVLRHGQLDSVLAQIPVVPFESLDASYRAHAGIDAAWAQKLAKKTWYAPLPSQQYLCVVGKFQLRDFMVHDALYAQGKVVLAAQDQRFLTIDRRVLHKLLDLLLWMQDNELNVNAVKINYGFRHPAMNLRAGGAKASRHQLGEAIDLLIGDVNRDALVDEADKKPLLAILENKIIAQGGGVGRYPGSIVIHIDVRGYKARWDHQ